jgi:pSer/pThr/pTyr-binding forkhead associated (FHA) protein
MPARITLIATEGPLEGQEFIFDARAVCTVGRSHDCGVQLPNGPSDLSASRHHCELDIDPPHVWIRDLGSRNGTYVNGEAIGRHPRQGRPGEGTEADRPGWDLHDGDSIRMGRNIFRVGVVADPVVIKAPPGTAIATNRI